jgi:glyoxylase-like metal-dependent hydrolase (beta-lactamase superfamily II)
MMRIIFIIGILLTHSMIVISQSINKRLSISKLLDDFYIYTTYKVLNGSLFPSNGMYVVTDSGIIMIDTPWDIEQTYPLLDSIEKRHNKEVKSCIVTHYHDDRTAGLDLLKQRGIKTYSSFKTWILCKEKNERQAEFYFIGDTIYNFGNYILLTYYPGEGHTKDNIVIWFKKEKILYGGCLIKSIESHGLGNIVDANIVQWSISVKNVIRKFPKTSFIIPGHFDWSDKNSLKHTLKLLKRHGSS